MSIVSDTFQEVNLNKIPARIALYEQLCDAAEPCFELNGKHLEDVCKNHAKDLMFYDMMLQECKTIEDTIRLKIEEVESSLYRHLNENNGNRALGTTDIKQYIKSEPRYVQAYEILLEVVHVKRKLEAIVEALKSLGWSIGHIVKLRIAQLEKITL